MVATAIYSVTMVLWKETAYPLDLTKSARKFMPWRHKQNGSELIGHIVNAANQRPPQNTGLPGSTFDDS